MCDYLEKYTEIEYFPLTKTIRGRLIFDKYILIENLKDREDAIKSSPEYLTKQNGDIWFTVILDMGFLIENLKDNLILNYLNFLDFLNFSQDTIDIERDIELPEKILALVIHNSGSQKIIFRIEEDKIKYEIVLKNLISFTNFLPINL